MFVAMEYQPRVLRLLDQRLLPQAEVWLECRDVEAVAQAIEGMAVRGAPAIGCAAAFALALAARSRADGPGAWGDYAASFAAERERLARSRPTAVALSYALSRIAQKVAVLPPTLPLGMLADVVDAEAKHLFAGDLATCKAIGAHGARLAAGRRLRLLTHCNTGSLATAGVGTALGVIRALHASGQIAMVHVDETRPYLQGARLTAYELRAEGIPYQVLVDAAAAYLMQLGRIDWVLVGADRIAANGDTANKIGTYGLAVLARYHKIPFYVAASCSTIDLDTATGALIPVEERAADEVRSAGGKLMTTPDAPVFNPAFDVTPAHLITGIITESGLLQAPYTEATQAAVKTSLSY